MKTISYFCLFLFLTSCSTMVKWKSGVYAKCKPVVSEPVSLCRAETYCRDFGWPGKSFFSSAYPNTCVDDQLKKQQDVAGHPPDQRYVSQKVYEEDFPRVVRVKCAGKIDDYCVKILNDMLNAKFEIEYPYADWPAATRWCKANPIECDFKTWKGAAEFEDQLMETNDNNMNRTQDDKQVRIQAQQEFYDQQRRAQIMQIVGALSPKTSNCVTNTVGGTAYTSCR